MHSHPDSSRSLWSFSLVFLLVSFNLRMSFAAADPLLVFLMRELHLGISSGTLFGLIPIIALGLAAPLGAWLCNFIRPRRLITLSMLVALGGILWRSYGGIPGLFGGMLIIGLGLGVTGSVILGIARQVVPTKNLPRLMAGYTACVSLGTAAGSGAADPVELWLGDWQESLLFWGLPLLFATILWHWHVHRHPGVDAARQSTVHAPLGHCLRRRKAWYITFFYMFRVAGNWLLTVWLASLMRKRGLPLVESGMVLAISTLCQIPGALLTPRLLTRLKGHSGSLLLIIMPLAVTACSIMLLAPLKWWLAGAVLFGLCSGIIFAMGMTFIILNAGEEADTLALSGMAQGIGFIGGGFLAWWGGSLALRQAAPHYAICLLYGLFTLGGLINGWKSAPQAEI